MFNRRLLVFAGLVILVVVALGALAWFIGPRLGWGPMVVGTGCGQTCGRLCGPVGTVLKESCHMLVLAKCPLGGAGCWPLASSGFWGGCFRSG